MTSCFVALLSSCAKPSGDFCDIAKPDVYATDEVAEYLVVNDPAHVRADIAENEYGRRHCDWF